MKSAMSNRIFRAVGNYGSSNMQQNYGLSVLNESFASFQRVSIASCPNPFRSRYLTFLNYVRVAFRVELQGADLCLGGLYLFFSVSRFVTGFFYKIVSIRDAINHNFPKSVKISLNARKGYLIYFESS